MQWFFRKNTGEKSLLEMTTLLSQSTNTLQKLKLMQIIHMIAPSLLHTIENYFYEHGFSPYHKLHGDFNDKKKPKAKRNIKERNPINVNISLIM